MTNRRILALWFPRLGAERVLRADRGLLDVPVAVVRETANLQTLCSLSLAAEAAGLRAGQPLRDARAMCPALITRAADPRGEAATLRALRRWAGQFSPWVAEEPPAALVVDLTGCAHLFGGEVPLLAQVEQDCADLGLSLQAGIADTLGAAWALSRFGGRNGGANGGAGGTAAQRSGDAIDQEARATRSRAVKRRNWERGGAAPSIHQAGAAADAARIAPPGRTRAAIAPLPMAALRLNAEDVAALHRLGLRRVEDLAGQPRAAIARRFGRAVVQRLDQALGLEPEPVSPAAAETRFALRLGLPDPIGLTDDVTAAIDLLLPRLSARLERAGRGARRVRLQAFRCDHEFRSIEVGLARPSFDPARIRPLLLLKLDQIDAGPGIDALRIEAYVTEPVHARQHKGQLEVTADVTSRTAGSTAMDDLIGRLGARVGMEAITRLHPADSHIPEKSAQVLAAAWSAPAPDWPASPVPRPAVIWRPEPVTVPAAPSPGGARPGPPAAFRWRRRARACVAATGPERIAPEWWLDDPAWRSGVRDYWHVVTGDGERLWLYYAHGGEMSGGWFCQGSFK